MKKTVLQVTVVVAVAIVLSVICFVKPTIDKKNRIAVSKR